jgi:hypothetical protein
MSDDLPFGSRGGIAVRHHFPLDGEYIVKIRMQPDGDGYIRGLAEAHQLEVRLDGARLKAVNVGGQVAGNAGAVYTEVGGEDEAQEKAANTAPIRRAMALDSVLEVRVQAKAGTRLVGVDFLKKTSEPESVLRPLLAGSVFARERDSSTGVASVTIVGPYGASGLGDTPSRRQIFTCRPTGTQDEQPCAKKILSNLARRAYRRPVTDEEVQTLMGFFSAGQNEAGFDEGIVRALERILTSPKFLFRIERDPLGATARSAYQISDLELASRLSFFLWSTIPDEDLLDLATKGMLRDPAILEAQVRRMLADSRSAALASNFSGQWLYLRNMQALLPDPDGFPEFDENLRAAFQRETELFFEYILREDRSVLELLDADYTFLNERLARFYEIPNVYGSHFRRVKLDHDSRRGLLGQGSILTVTSYSTRTAPTIRGKWLLENFMGTPPPPPPPNVPSLGEKKGDDGRPLTVRQQMEQHRANAVCASCHKVMDPLGFALENFDAIGKWRNVDGGRPIDSSGVAPDGTALDGPADLRKFLLARPDQFVTTLTEKLLTYALGRGVEYYDAAAVRRIVKESARSNYTPSSLVLGVVKSVPFTMRRSREP